MQFQKHVMWRTKRAMKDLAKIASIERLRSRIIAPNSTSLDEKYMDVDINDKNSVFDKNEFRMWNNISEINEHTNIRQAVENTENEREQGGYNEDVIEAFDLSDNEYEVGHEDDTSEDSEDYYEDLHENYFETEEQKAIYVA